MSIVSVFSTFYALIHAFISLKSFSEYNRTLGIGSQKLVFKDEQHDRLCIGRWFAAHNKKTKGESVWVGYNTLADFVKVLQEPKTRNPVKKLVGGKFVLRTDDEFITND